MSRAWGLADEGSRGECSIPPSLHSIAILPSVEKCGRKPESFSDKYPF